MNIQEIQILSTILDAITLFVFLYILSKINSNTRTTNEYLEYIISKINEGETKDTLDEIEEELSQIREELDNTRQ